MTLSKVIWVTLLAELRAGPLLHLSPLTALSYLAVLVLAFVGADVSDSSPSVGFEPREHDAPCWLWPEDYSEQWYRWESCAVTGDRPATKAEAQAILDEVWDAWLPWLRGRVGGAFDPPKPNLQFGYENLVEYCGPGIVPAGCFSARGPLRGENRIVVAWPGLTLRTLLHEIAHATNFFHDHVTRTGFAWYVDPSYTPQWGGFEADARSEVLRREYERTRGHTLDFRCQALSLYRDYGLVTAEVFTVLDSVCAVTTPISSSVNRDALSLPAGQWCSAHPAPFGDEWADLLDRGKAKRSTCTMTGESPEGGMSGSTNVTLSAGRWRVKASVIGGSAQRGHDWGEWGGFRVIEHPPGTLFDENACGVRLTDWPSDTALLVVGDEVGACSPGHFQLLVNTIAREWTLTFEPVS